MRWFRHVPLAVLVVAALHAPTSALADGRALGEHLFAPSELVSDPFTPTYFHVSTGYGVGQGDGPRFNLLGQRTGVGEYEVGVITQAFELQLEAIPGWAVRMTGEGTINAGINDTAALAFGAGGSYRFGAGTTLSGAPCPWIRLGATLDIDYAPGRRLNLIEGVSRSVREARLDAESLVADDSLATLMPGMAGAVALGEAAGLTFSAQLRHGFSGAADVVRGGDDVVLAAGLDLALGAVVALTGAYQASIPVLGAEDDVVEPVHRVEGGIFYAGRPDIVVGAQGDVSWRDLPLGRLVRPGTTDRTETIDLRVILVRLVLRYYW